MVEHIETPLNEKFRGKPRELGAAAKLPGGTDMTGENGSADLAVMFRPLPRIPAMRMFWNEDQNEDFDAEAKLLFDETITEHLDIESIMLLSERLRQLLCEATVPKSDW